MFYVLFLYRIEKKWDGVMSLCPANASHAQELTLVAESTNDDNRCDVHLAVCVPLYCPSVLYHSMDCLLLAWEASQLL